MTRSKFIVIDASVWIDYVLKEKNAVAAIEKIIEMNYIPVQSEKTMKEVENVSKQARHEHILPFQDRMEIVEGIRELSGFLEHTYEVSASKDVDDNIYLGLAIQIGADNLVTKDKKHLLPLKHYHGVQIWSPEQFVAHELEVEKQARILTERDKAHEPGKRLSAKDMADELMGRGREKAQPKQEPAPEIKNDPKPSIGPDFSRGIELRQRKPTDEET